MKGQNMMTKAHKTSNDSYRKNYEKIFRQTKKGRNDPITEEEIQEIKDEFLKKSVIGSDPPEPVKVSSVTAQCIIRARRSHQEWLDSVHESHDMTDWNSQIRAPSGTERFYSVRECVNCGYEQAEHPAGQFMDYQLKHECEGM
jgi:hypothetical protein